MIRALVIALAFVAAPAAAQTNDALLECAKIADGERRLACFDAAVARLVPESSPIIAERRKAEAAAAAARAAREAQARADRFGSEGLKIGRDDDRVEQIETKLSEVFTDRSGRSVLALANGQIWRQIAGLGIGSVRDGDAIRIKRGIAGGYRLTFLRQNRTIGVERVR